tara:strand:- start:617 stop:844 length:228 start_codon:yes stop_codon:yes gene_type:complete
VAKSLPDKWFNKVVLPAPEAPIILMNSPEPAHPVTLSRIVLPGITSPLTFVSYVLIETFSQLIPTLTLSGSNYFS